MKCLLPIALLIAVSAASALANTDAPPVPPAPLPSPENVPVSPPAPIAPIPAPTPPAAPAENPPAPTPPPAAEKPKRQRKAKSAPAAADDESDDDGVPDATEMLRVSTAWLESLRPLCEANDIQAMNAADGLARVLPHIRLLADRVADRVTVNDAVLNALRNPTATIPDGAFGSDRDAG